MRIWIERATRMTAADYATAFEVLALALWVEAALTVMPFSRVLERVNGMRSPRSTMDDANECQRLSRFVDAAYDLLPVPATCLRRGMVLHGLLARRGKASRLCLGVARNGSTLDAHAWIECEGLAADRSSERFSQLEAMSREP